MLLFKILFWLFLFIIFYSYLGYGILVFFWLKVRRFFGKQSVPAQPSAEFEPPVTLLVAAYNEEDCVREKVANSLALDYPAEKLTLMFVTDGSTDRTPDVLREYEQLTVLHKPGRAGKIGAINRAMPFVKTPIVLFSDANTMFNRDAVRELVKHYQNPKVGAVSGEKRIRKSAEDSASGAGEGIYWKYESFLKKMDAELYSIVGAAGEMFSIRTELFEPVEPDTILDDFMISLRIAEKGYRVLYEPKAYALETPSASVADEYKRKVRISAGGFQSMARLKNLLNIFKYGVLSFQYISHRVLRWAIDPFALVALLPINFVLMQQAGGIYTFLFVAQVLFYLLAVVGWYFERQQIRVKLLFVPFYFSMMNWSVLAGFRRYLKGQQSVLWEKAARK